MTNLKKELAEISASLPTAIDGGNGLAGIVIKNEKYVTVSGGGVEFTITDYPGYYPAAAWDDTKVRAKEEAQHKENILDHDVCAGVVKVMKDFIVEEVDEGWLSKIDDTVMGCTKKTPIEMLDHLETRGEALDYV